MKPEDGQLLALRTLILKSQCEPLSESEIAQLNDLIQSEGGGEEAAALIDQLCAFTDSASLDSLPMKEVLSEALGKPTSVGTLSTRADSTSRTPSVDPSHDATAPRQADRWTKAYWLLALAASYFVVATFAWHFAKGLPIDRPAMVALESTSPRPVSVNSPQLVSMTACVWRSSGDSVPTVGESIQVGEVLNLVEGIAELRIGEGTPGEALVRIEGPASAFIRAGGQLGFLRGSLTVKSLGTGFRAVTVDTPVGEVLVDGQSSLGLVSQGPVNEIHLFTGRALVSPNQVATAAPELQLEEGDAVRYTSKPDEDLEIVRFEASMDGFASARSSGFDPLKIGKQYVDAVLASEPSIYWRFEKLEGKFPSFVANQGSVPNLNAVVVGDPGWRQYGDNRVAELGLSASSSAFRATEPWPTKPLEEYTIELWVKPQLFHHGEVICLHALEELEDGRYPHTMMLETIARHYHTHRLKDSPPNRYRFVHRPLRSNQPISVTSMYSGQQYQARVWQHVVAQKQGERKMLWIDGKLSAEQSNPAPLTENVQILVGQVYPNSSYRRFVGQIDEVAIYDRCLTPQELRKHIKAAGRSVARRESDSSGRD